MTWATQLGPSEISQRAHSECAVDCKPRGMGNRINDSCLYLNEYRRQGNCRQLKRWLNAEITPYFLENLGSYHGIAMELVTVDQNPNNYQRNCVKC